jgi:hypothetical protein
MVTIPPDLVVAQNAVEIKKAPNLFPFPLSTSIFETFGVHMSFRVPNPSLDSTTVTNLTKSNRASRPTSSSRETQLKPKTSNQFVSVSFLHHKKDEKVSPDLRVAQNAVEIKKAPNLFPFPLSTSIFETFGVHMSFRVPNPSLESTTVTNLPNLIVAHDAGVETAVALSSVPACPYAGPLLTSTRVEETVFGVSEGLPR